MKRLGYERFVAAGGDYGALVIEYMAGGRDAPASPEPAPPELLGYHTNFPGVFPLDVDAAIRTGGALPSDLSAGEQRAIEQLGSEYKHAAYAVQLGTRPQTMYGLNDSPVGLAAFQLDHDPKSYELIARAFVDGVEEGLTRDDILDNITLFWLTNTGVSSSKAFWEYLGYGSFANVRNVTVPVAVSVFPDELYQAPRSWTEKAYTDLIHFNEVDRGGHFAAWEQPEIYASELRTACARSASHDSNPVHPRSNHMAVLMTETSTRDTTIRPFTIEIPEADLEDLRARIAATRWPEKETVEDASQGVQLATMQALARYWETEYDWRKSEARLNAYPQFITEIDGLDIHFVHVRSKHEDALPVVVSHGWPGSFIEQMKIVDLLTDPTAHGGSASDAFHVVIPNMPGYGFSGKPTETGWDVARIGRAWVELMKRLGYARFVAAGGDWGGILVDVMAAAPTPPRS